MQHLSRLLLKAVIQGDLPVGLVTRIAMEHMLKLCPECRHEYDLMKAALAARVKTPQPQVLSSVLTSHIEDLRSRTRGAKRDFTELMKLPVEERAGRIARARHRFRGSHLVHLLLDNSQEVIARSPYEALHLAEMANAVALQGRDFYLHVLVLAHIGNASRAAGKFSEADEFFSQARQTIVGCGLDEDPALLARVDDLESSLRIDQSRLDEGEELLARALFLYSMAEAPPVTKARVLVKLGVLYQRRGDLGAAVDVARAALNAVPPRGDFRLYFAALYNLATFLVDMGDTKEATKLLAENQEIFADVSEPLHLIRITGLRGKIAAVAGDLAMAEEALLKTRDGFLACGNAFAYDAAIVSLDLALLYAKQDRTADLQSTVAAMIPIFEANELHREALAAVVLLQESLQREKKSQIVLMRELVVYFQQAQQSPALRFKP
jgi:tetratricopeptide (TPR) repeat protein